MKKILKKFKTPPKKFQPRGLPLVYEDHDILVANKTAGLLTVSTEGERDRTAFALLTDYVRKGNHKSKKQLFIVHRLDRDTSGLILFAKSEEAKRYLQDNWNDFKKMYYVVVNGVLKDKEGTISSYLTENSVHKMYSVSDPKKGKLAKTGYRVKKESAKYSLLEVALLTGRKNQIRAHFAEKGHPVAGDKKYGAKEKGIKRLMLHSSSLVFNHPYSKEKISFKTKVPTYFDVLLKEGRS